MKKRWKKRQKLNYLWRQEESLFQSSSLSISVALCFLLSINLVLSASLSLRFPPFIPVCSPSSLWSEGSYKRGSAPGERGMRRRKGNWKKEECIGRGIDSRLNVIGKYVWWDWAWAGLRVAGVSVHSACCRHLCVCVCARVNHCKFRHRYLRSNRMERGSQFILTTMYAYPNS